MPIDESRSWTQDLDLEMRPEHLNHHSRPGIRHYELSRFHPSRRHSALCEVLQAAPLDGLGARQRDVGEKTQARRGQERC